MKSIPSSQSWIEKNIDTMMAMISMDARKQRPLPLSISMHGLALKKFVQILKSKASFFPNADGRFSFLGIPVKANNNLPYGTFVLERFKEVAEL